MSSVLRNKKKTLAKSLKNGSQSIINSSSNKTLAFFCNPNAHNFKEISYTNSGKGLSPAERPFEPSTSQPRHVTPNPLYLQTKSDAAWPLCDQERSGKAKHATKNRSRHFDVSMNCKQTEGCPEQTNARWRAAGLWSPGRDHTLDLLSNLWAFWSLAPGHGKSISF